MTDRHRALLKEYRAEMRDAMKTAKKWWTTLVASEVTESGVAAEAEVARRWPDGAASHPLVIGTIVKFLHLCSELNRSVGQDEAVDLNRFAIEGLDSDASEDVAEFTESLSYWPIGFDDQGQLV